MNNFNEIRINNKTISENSPVFIIAEAGVNHNGDIKIAKQLVEEAKNAGADAIKFQTYKTENIVLKSAEKAEYQKRTTGNGSQYEMLRKLELTKEDFRELANYAKIKGIIFLSTPSDKESVDLLCQLNVPLFKIGSSDITNFPLLKYVAEKRLPIVLSTGMSNLGEIEEAIKIIKDNGSKQIILLHCITNYPAKISNLNLRVINTLKSTFKLLVGFSDHSIGIYAAISAVSLGACVIEKHFTLSKDQQGPDHLASLNPNELREMIKAIRLIKKGLGNGLKIPTEDEEKIKKIARKSIVSKVNIPKGETISMDMLGVKRPGTGLSPKYLNIIIGRRAKEEIKKDKIINLKLLE